ncbi:hypothetical protein [Campylobacter sp. LR286c]|uniref:hypothetical protein n=1 Tax=Campylobacter sp. LR286c TaxID=2593545 RepID=UPI001237B4DF|nr:hypothetical protein [Campylobacter sp. LR286c]KAA6226307.1 hypothetical protein FMM57_05875 [Campylobacter sp. LR286c]
MVIHKQRWAFNRVNRANYSVIESEITITGKLTGHDKSIDETNLKFWVQAQGIFIIDINDTSSN